jgi:hypothetical protein
LDLVPEVFNLYKETAKNEVPGPGQYNPFAHHNKTLPKWSLGTE